MVLTISLSSESARLEGEIIVRVTAKKRDAIFSWCFLCHAWQRTSAVISSLVIKVCKKESLAQKITQLLVNLKLTKVNEPP